MVPINQIIKKINLKKYLQVKISELNLAAFLAEHDLSFKMMEHLPYFIKLVCVDSGVAVVIKVSRMKTTKIIKEKIGPNITKKYFVNTIFFSIIIDETPDVSTKKII